MNQQQQQQQQQQQPVAMTTQMVSPTALYVNSTGNTQVQPGSIVPTVAYVTMPPTTIRDPSVAETYQSRQSQALGMALVIIGASAFILHGIGLAVGDAFAYFGHGFWSGVPVLCAIAIIVYLFESKQLDRKQYIYRSNKGRVSMIR